MKNNILEYKGYYTEINYDQKDRILFGKIEGIRDLVDFHSEDANEIEDEFHNAVDDYLSFCNEIGKTPEKAFKGAFNVRLTEDLHRKLYLKAEEDGITLNKLMENIVKKYFNDDSNDNYTEYVEHQGPKNISLAYSNNNENSQQFRVITGGK